MAKDYTMYVVLAGVGIGGFLLYQHFKTSCVGAITGSGGGMGPFNFPICDWLGLSTPASQAIPGAHDGALAVIPAASSSPAVPAAIAVTAIAPVELSGPSKDLRDGLVAAWLGSQGKQWDATALASPKLKVSEWDALFQGSISPYGKPLGGSNSVTADDYVKARASAGSGLSGLGCSRVPMGAIHGPGGYRLWRAG